MAPAVLGTLPGLKLAKSSRKEGSDKLRVCRGSGCANALTLSCF